MPLAAADDDSTVNITYVGFNSPDTFSAIETIIPRHLSSLPDNYKINYNYISGYNTTDSGEKDWYNYSPELLEFVSDTGDLSAQDIVIFDMVFVKGLPGGDGTSIFDDLKVAKEVNTNLKIIQIRADEVGTDDLFYTQADENLVYYLSLPFYAHTFDTQGEKRYPEGNARFESTNGPLRAEGRTLTHLITTHLLKTYAPEKAELQNIPDQDKMNILYVGYDFGGTSASRNSGVEGFNSFVDVFRKTMYVDYFDQIQAVSYGTTPDGSPFIFDETNKVLYNHDWYSNETLTRNIAVQNIDLDSVDVIILDGFFDNEILEEFEGFFEMATDKGIILIFNNIYVSSTSSTQFLVFASPDGEFSSSSDADIAIKLNYPDSNNVYLIRQIPLNSIFYFDSPLSNKRGDTVASYSCFSQFGSEFVQGMRIPTATAYLTLPSGFIFHPVAKMYFETTEEYMSWYKYQSGRYTDGAPFIGIFGFSSVYYGPMQTLTEILEGKGYNVIVGGGDADGVYDDMTGYFLDANGDCYVTCLISLKNWALNYGNQQEGVYELEKLNVPVIKVVGSSGWGETTGYDANSGISASTFTWMASPSNVDGMIDFIGYNDENKEWITDRAIAWAELNNTSNADKKVVFMYYNYPPGKEEIGANYLNVMRSFAGDGAKDRVTAGCSTVAITEPDYQGIFRELRTDGYNVKIDKLPLVTIETGGKYAFDYTVTDEKLILNEENLINLIYAQGINVAGYAPGVLDTMVRQRVDFIDAGNDPDDWWGCELIPVSDYLKWLEHETTPKSEGGNGTMDQKLYNDLVKTWGTPAAFGPIPANTAADAAWGGMIWNDKDNIVGGGADRNYVVVPMIKLGNIRIMPEPNRALASDKALDSATYHSGDLPPTHQYVATYFWLNRGTADSTGSGETGFYNGEDWKADAVVHFGTHGTQEWLPGTSVGLYRTHDWGPVLLPDIPNIYPYIVANVGEGLTAEYRGNAVIISHLTPPMVKTRLYDDIIDMETAIRGYQKQVSSGMTDTAILGAYRQIIVEDVYKLGWNDAFPEQFALYKKTVAADKYRNGDISKVKDSDLKKVTDKDVTDYLVSNKDGVFDIFLENQLHSFVESIKENSLSYGTHTYGTFNEEQIAPMVWNMWSRQGFDDILLDTYFDDVQSIPTTNKGLTYPNGTAIPDDDVNSKYTEDDVLKFVEKMTDYGTTTPNAAQIRTDLQTVFNKETGTPEQIKAKEDKMIYFLLGPAGTISDMTNYATAEDVVWAWQNTFIGDETTQTTKSMYDQMVDDLFEFYFYFEVPAKLATEDSTKGSRQDTKGNYLNDAEMRKAMIQFIEDVRAGPMTYENVEKALAKDIGMTTTARPWYNDQMTYMMLANNRIDYGNALQSCGPSEMNALKNALSAGYITPSPGNDPVLNPNVLPTGRNFYGIDPSTYSTPAAWRVGQAMGEQLLIDYYQKYGEFPKTVSFMRFGVDFIQDEGTLEACLFYLLGCEPTWNAQGVFTGAKPVVQGDSNYDEMFKLTFKNGKGKTVTVDRPRVDIVYNSAGMRDGYGSMLRYIDRAVKAVANLEDGADRSSVTNNVKINVQDMIEILKKAGLSQSEAEKLATARVFAQELGNYEIGTGNLVSASGNLDPNSPTYQDDLKAITDMYLAKMGYLYTEDNWGESSEAITKMLQALLGRTDASIFASAGNLYDSLDNDDVFQYFGIMNMASSMYDKDGNYIKDKNQWKMPQTYIADTSNIHNYKDGDKIVYTAAEYIQKDITARLLNPEWMQGQKEAGYSGAMMIAEYIENFYGWSVASNGELIGQETWNKVFEAFANDPDMVDWMSSTSPYALQSVTARMIEASRTGYWDANDEQMKQLMETYVKDVIEHGVACCHHSCGNPSLDKFIAGQMSVLGLTPDEEKAYWEAVKDATERDKPSETSKPTSSTTSGGGFGTAAVSSGPTADGSNAGDTPSEGSDVGGGYGTDGTTPGTPGTPVSGYEMTTSIQNAANSVKDFIANPSFSASSMIAVALVILIIGAVFYGYRRKGI
ncbi:cobaltochelatase subunit CobN [Methanolapillus africanus]